MSYTHACFDLVPMYAFSSLFCHFSFISCLAFTHTQASHVMKDVKNMAIAMGTEIASSTQDLDALDSEVGDTVIRMKKVNKRIDYEIKNN